ncbi:H-NS histone family protein [Propionivibrio sp.]|uniref:H-NS histone family protein n=1 Tax=Propionivibrio sp. TaxID=2212460 RepID=UPI0039E3D705
MESYQSILAKISVLHKKASELRESEKKRAVAEMRKLIELYDVKASELFSNAPAAAGRAVPAPAKKTAPPKYRDPATGKTWSGRGKRPTWLVGDKDAYLIDAPAGLAGKAQKPKAKVQAKAKPAAAKKPGAAKTTAKPKSAAKRKPVQKTALPKTESVAPAAAPEPAALPTAA